MFKRINRNRNKKNRGKDFGNTQQPFPDDIVMANKKPKTFDCDDKETQNRALKKILDHLQKDLEN